VRSRVPAGVRRAVFGPLGRWYPKLDWAPRFVRGKTTFQALARGTVDAYLHACRSARRRCGAALLSAFRRELQGYDAREVFHGHARGKSFDDALSLVQYLDYKTYLPGDILTKVDRASMAHSLEVRTPFLDYEFVEWAASLPADVKLRGGEGKAVLKKALEPVLPRECCTAPRWASRCDRRVVPRLAQEAPRRDHQGPRLAECGVFDPAELRAHGGRSHSGRRNHSAPLWTLLMFDGFLRQHEAEARPGPRWPGPARRRERVRVLSVCRYLPDPGSPAAGGFVFERIAAMAALTTVTILQRCRISRCCGRCPAGPASPVTNTLAGASSTPRCSTCQAC